MLYTPGKLSDKEMTAIRKQYDYYKITYKNGKVSGLPIFMAVSYTHLVPAIPVEQSRILLLWEPDDGGRSDDMVFGDKSEQTGVWQVYRVVGTHPIVIFHKVTMLYRFSFYV